MCLLAFSCGIGVNWFEQNGSYFMFSFSAKCGGYTLIQSRLSHRRQVNSPWRHRMLSAAKIKRLNSAFPKFFGVKGSVEKFCHCRHQNLNWCYLNSSVWMWVNTRISEKHYYKSFAGMLLCMSFPPRRSHWNFSCANSSVHFFNGWKQKCFQSS